MLPKLLIHSLTAERKRLAHISEARDNILTELPFFAAQNFPILNALTVFMALLGNILPMVLHRAILID